YVKKDANKLPVVVADVKLINDYYSYSLCYGYNQLESNYFNQELKHLEGTDHYFGHVVHEPKSEYVAQIFECARNRTLEIISLHAAYQMYLQLIHPDISEDDNNSTNEENDVQLIQNNNSDMAIDEDDIKSDDTH